MKKIAVLIAVTFLYCGVSKSQIFIGKESVANFFSKTAMEDIDGKNNAGQYVLNSATGDIQVKLTQKGFKFKSGLMEEHYNENFIESNKYPYAVFKGKINEKIDYSKDGENKVTVKGTMEMHGVTQNITVDGNVTVKGKEVIIDAKFKIKLSDYNIKDPTLIGTKIAEVVDVTVKSNLEMYNKK